jgi:trehalose 6-phosphate synthase/phosphatase
MEGLNLVCKEYVASRVNKDGVLILSEMAGASKELADAILVNPTDQEQMVQALHTALNMKEEEQSKHMEVMQETVSKYDIFNWVKLFFDNLNNVKAGQEEMATLTFDNPKLEALKEAYKEASNRLILLDYDGTLVGFKSNPLDCEPDEELREMLKTLGKNPRNEVYVISGRKAETLSDWLDDLPIHLIAEHGLWRKCYNQDWERSDISVIDGWKDTAMEIMNFYVDRTPGSFVEEKSHSLAWHYRRVEKGLGEVRKSELTSHLKHMLGERGFHVLDGDHVVELKPDGINKGKVAVELYGKHRPEFTFCAGDDLTDEDMFRSLPSQAYTVKVGPGSSHARYSVEGRDEVRNLIREFIRIG